MVKQKILVVDNNPFNRDVLARRLRRQGYLVEPAETGLEALNKIIKGGYALVFLDLKLGDDLNGYEIVEQLQRLGILQFLPIIVISSGDDMNDVARCIELGAEDYLQKPLNPVLLKARLRASLEKKRLQDQQQEYLLSLDQTIFPSTIVKILLPFNDAPINGLFLLFDSISSFLNMNSSSGSITDKSALAPSFI